MLVTKLVLLFTNNKVEIFLFVDLWQHYHQALNLIFICMYI